MGQSGLGGKLGESVGVAQVVLACEREIRLHFSSYVLCLSTQFASKYTMTHLPVRM